MQRHARRAAPLRSTALQTPRSATGASTLRRRIVRDSNFLEGWRLHLERHHGVRCRLGSRGDRFHRCISALRQANIYERQRYRHIVGLPTVLGTRDGATEVETPFLIVRIMRDGRMDVFATGCYRDKVQANGDGSLRFAERVVVCDGSRFDTLVAIPF